MAELKTVPLSQIRENPNALREVNKQTEEYEGLVDSIRTRGVLQPVLLRECVDEKTQEPFYGLVDGLHRFTASKDAGKDDIPANIVNMDDAALLEAQIITNIHKIETKPAEYSKQLKRIMAMTPTMTALDLASRLGRSLSWINDRLSLGKLAESIQKLVDDGTINLSNAYALSKLDDTDQPNFLDRAMTMPPTEFIPTVNVRVKEVLQARRQGRDPVKSEFQPVAYLRKLGELKDELQTGSVGRELLAQFNVQGPAEAFAMAVKWCLSLDPVSARLQVEKENARVADLEAKKAAKAKERAEKKQSEKNEVAASVLLQK
jgi:ParB family chromosome partitioning protein